MKNSANPTLCPTHDNYVYFQPNPSQRKASDCAIRAVSKALGITWSDAYKALCVKGILVGMMPNSSEVVSRVLREKGFVWFSFAKGAKITKVHEVAKRFSHYTLVLACRDHVVCAQGGKYYDAGDSGEMLVKGLWVKKPEPTSSGE